MRAPNPDEPSAFISYSSADSEVASKLAADLRTQDLGVWFDRWEIRVGDSLLDKINEGIKSKDFLIVLLSPASARSEWVRKELNAAMQREMREKRPVVLPCLLEVCDLPPFLEDKKYADFSQDYATGLGTLVRAIKDHHSDLLNGSL